MQLKSCLRTLGFSATNDIFAENAWYFRNALVRANYTNLQKGIHETTEYLEVFFRNLLLNEKNELHNRNLHISELLNEEKVDMGNAKVDIENVKVDIESVLPEKDSNFSVKTMVHIHDSPQQGGCDMGIYLNPSSIGFKRSLNSEIYVDKTGLIEKTNALLDTEQKFICVSRPRRFGKSMAVNMLSACSACGEDSLRLLMA